MRSVALLAATAAICSLAACGSAATNNTTSTGGTATADGSDTAAAQQSAQSASDAGASDNAAGGHSPSAFMDAVLAADAAINTLPTGNFNNTVTVGGCAVNLTGATSLTDGLFTLNANTTFSAAACTGKHKMEGYQSVSATWTSLSTYSRTVQVTDDFTRTMANGTTVRLSSLATTPAYTYRLTASGRPQDGNVTLTAEINAHHVATATNGNIVFDHSISTDANNTLQIHNTFNTEGLRPLPQTRTVVSGTVTLHHNLANFEGTHTFTNVVHDLTGACTCPTSGTIVQTVVKDDNSGSYVRTYTFTGCGQATVVTSASTLSGTNNGTASMTWNDCDA